MKGKRKIREQVLSLKFQIQQAQNIEFLQTVIEKMQTLQHTQNLICLTQQKNCLDIFTKYLKGVGVSHLPFRLYATKVITKPKNKMGGARGPYRRYTPEQKDQIIERMFSGESLKKISEETMIPKRNLIRWKHEYLHKRGNQKKLICQESEQSVEVECHYAQLKKDFMETKEILSEDQHQLYENEKDKVY